MAEAGRDRRWRRLAGILGAPLLAATAVAIAFAVTGGDDDAAVRTTGPTSTTPPATTDTTNTTNPAADPDPGASTVPTTVGATPQDTPVTTTTPPGPRARVQVRFDAGSGVRLRDGRLVSEAGLDMGPLEAMLADYPGIVIERLFQRPEADLDAERAAAEARTGLPQPDLNLYFRLTVAEGVDPAPLIADLGQLAIVERAYADPVAAPPPM